MTVQYDQVRNQIFKLFTDAWNLNSSAIATYIPEIRYQGDQERATPDGSKFFVRISKNTILEEQSTLSDCTMQPGKKRYTASGLVFVQLFCPKSDTQSFVKGEQLAIIARDAFRGKTTAGKIWFRNARINEIPQEHLFYRFNIIAEFEYDEIG